MAGLYLQLRAGPMLVLLEASGVHEVLESGWQGQARDQAQWRSQVLPVIRLGRFFGFDDARDDAGVVCSVGPDEPAVLFAAGAVLGLHAIDSQEWKRLPALPARVEHFFDAAFAGSGQQALSYRLRGQLRGADFGVAVD